MADPASPSSRLDGIFASLYARRAAGIHPGLETEHALLDALERPERRMGLVLHVAGTNGKGSVCAFLAAGLEALGVRTGMYTSPHLVRLHERFRVNGKEPSDEQLEGWIRTVEAADRCIREAPGGRPATFFEFVTAMAFVGFARQEVDAAVIETGMGGRLDATNVVSPTVCVITTIARDHTDYLGETLEAIAAEKAGICKPGIPVVLGRLDPRAAAVIRTHAAGVGCPIYALGEDLELEPDPGGGGRAVIRWNAEDETFLEIPRLPLPGAHQSDNAALAALTLAVLERQGLCVNAAEAVARGFPSTHWPGRMQRIDGRPPILLDGAHNPAGMAALLEALPTQAGGRPVAGLAAFLDDKDVVPMVGRFASAVDRLWVTEVSDPRASPARTVVGLLPAATRSRTRCSALDQALSEARDWARSEDGLVVVAGSLYLVGEVLSRLSPSGLEDA